MIPPDWAPRSKCPHLEFDAVVEVARVLEDGAPPTAAPVGFDVEVHVHCRACNTALRVLDPGLPVGVLPGRVTVDFAGRLRAPMWPDDGTAPPAGRRLAGFTITDRSERS